MGGRPKQVWLIHNAEIMINDFFSVSKGKNVSFFVPLCIYWWPADNRPIVRRGLSAYWCIFIQYTLIEGMKNHKCLQLQAVNVCGIFRFSQNQLSASIRGQFSRLELCKPVFGRGFTPDPTGGPYKPYALLRLCNPMGGDTAHHALPKVPPQSFRNHIRWVEYAIQYGNECMTCMKLIAARNCGRKLMEIN